MSRCIQRSHSPVTLLFIGISNKKAPAIPEASLSVRHKQGGILTTRSSWEVAAVEIKIAAVQHFTRIVFAYLPYKYCIARKDEGGSIMNSSQNPQEPP
jgi:hypothetical protein